MGFRMVPVSGIRRPKAARRIVERDPRSKMVGISMQEEESIDASMRGAGAVMYLSKVGPPAS
jgi:hypothetical protein